MLETGKRYATFVVLLIFVLVSVPLFAVEASSEMWSRTYGDEFIDQASSLVETSDGGYALAGVASFPVGIGPSYFSLIKTDVDGVIVWNQTYGGKGSYYAYAVVETFDGGYALAGTKSTDENYYDFLLVKTDANGNMIWNQTYGGSDMDLVYALVQTSDGGYALAGYTESFGSGGPDCWLIKTDANGNMIWNQTYGGEGGYYYASSLVETFDGGYAIGGYVSIGTGFDFLLIKTDAWGNMIWNKTFGGTLWDKAFSLVETSDKGYALAGSTNSFGSGSYDAWLVKTDGNGNMIWNRTYGGSGWDEAFSLVETSDKGYALAGSTNSFGSGSYDAWLVKTDANGNMIWNQTYGGSDRDEALAVIQASDGRYVLAGKTMSFGAGDYDDILLVKTVGSEGNSGDLSLPPTSILCIVAALIVTVIGIGVAIVYRRKNR